MWKFRSRGKVNLACSFEDFMVVFMVVSKNFNKPLSRYILRAWNSREI